MEDFVLFNTNQGSNNHEFSQGLSHLDYLKSKQIAINSNLQIDNSPISFSVHGNHEDDIYSYQSTLKKIQESLSKYLNNQNDENSKESQITKLANTIAEKAQYLSSYESILSQQEEDMKRRMSKINEKISQKNKPKQANSFLIKKQTKPVTGSNPSFPPPPEINEISKPLEPSYALPSPSLNPFVPLNTLPGSKMNQTTSNPKAGDLSRTSSSLNSTPFNSTPLNSTPFNSTPLSSSPFNSTQSNSTPFNSTKPNSSPPNLFNSYNNPNDFSSNRAPGLSPFAQQQTTSQPKTFELGGNFQQNTKPEQETKKTDDKKAAISNPFVSNNSSGSSGFTSNSPFGLGNSTCSFGSGGFSSGNGNGLGGLSGFGTSGVGGSSTSFFGQTAGVNGATVSTNPTSNKMNPPASMPNFRIGQFNQNSDKKSDHEGQKSNPAGNFSFDFKLSFQPKQ
ncbi:hypothetical protein TRFO_10223 [Tritrichomonas foetus]|uniref:Uncharacterized protein n=1 Tax=Tritrichomonas foetus TaxID=1144522 RepID=A0A1J4JBJ5_9EUKA|nr:hypothetical protein TRFO_10223 [Tritrichomonas foetus]|eukprot:OHS96041.1 hypothetical protein TRFO_10223 [Tritrichomonas foetus]